MIPAALRMALASLVEIRIPVDSSAIDHIAASVDGVAVVLHTDTCDIPPNSLPNDHLHRNAFIGQKRARQHSIHGHLFDGCNLFTR